MKRIQRTLVSVLLRSEFGILLLQRRLAYSEFLAVDFGSQVGVGLWELPGGGLDFGETPRRAGVSLVARSGAASPCDIALPSSGDLSTPSE